MPSKSASSVRLVRLYPAFSASEKNWGPVGTEVPSTCTSQVPAVGDEKFSILRLFKLSLKLVQVPDGSLTAKSKSLTRFVPALGVDSGS